MHTGVDLQQYPAEKTPATFHTGRATSRANLAMLRKLDRRPVTMVMDLIESYTTPSLCRATYQSASSVRFHKPNMS
jgi:hypothetical protein